jgi:hypothetical protein
MPVLREDLLLRVVQHAAPAQVVEQARDAIAQVVGRHAERRACAGSTAARLEPSYSTACDPTAPRPIACRADIVTSRSTWMRRNFAAPARAARRRPRARCTCQTSGTSARDSDSSLLEQVVHVARGRRREGPSASPSAISARSGSGARGPSSSPPGTPRPGGCRRTPGGAAAPSGAPCPAPARARRRRSSRAPDAPARGRSASARPFAPQDRQLDRMPRVVRVLAHRVELDHLARRAAVEAAGAGSGCAAPQLRQKSRGASALVLVEIVVVIGARRRRCGRAT